MPLVPVPNVDSVRQPRKPFLCRKSWSLFFLLFFSRKEMVNVPCLGKVKVFPTGENGGPSRGFKSLGLWGVEGGAGET